MKRFVFASLNAVSMASINHFHELRQMILIASVSRYFSVDNKFEKPTRRDNEEKWSIAEGVYWKFNHSW